MPLHGQFWAAVMEADGRMLARPLRALRSRRPQMLTRRFLPAPRTPRSNRDRDGLTLWLRVALPGQGRAGAAALTPHLPSRFPTPCELGLCPNKMSQLLHLSVTSRVSIVTADVHVTGTRVKMFACGLISPLSCGSRPVSLCLNRIFERECIGLY